MGSTIALRRSGGSGLVIIAVLMCVWAGTLAGVGPASAADVTVYLDTSAIDARTDLTKDEKEAVKTAIKDEIKSNLESAFGPGKVEVTDDAAKKRDANRTVTIKDDLGTDTDKDGATTYHWGEWEHGSSNTTVHLKNYMDRWGSTFKTGNPPKWDTTKLGKALGTTGAHEVAHSFSAGHDDNNTNKMSTSHSATELGSGQSLNPAANKTLQENKGNPPCRTTTNYSTECCIADWWSNPGTLPGHELHESRSITTRATFGGPLSPMFDFGWWGPDTDNGASDANPWGDFVYKSSMNGSVFDAPTITFFDGWTAHFVLRGRQGTPYAGQLVPTMPHQMVLNDPVIRPDGSEVFRQIELTWDIDGLPGADVSAHMTTDAFGPMRPLFSGFRRGTAVPQRVSPAEAKGLPSGFSAALRPSVATRVFEDHFCVQAPDRSAGIRVEWWGTGVTAPVLEGSGLLLQGVISTNADGERVLRADPSKVQTIVSPPVTALGLANKLLGGGDFKFEAGRWPSGQEGIPGMFGLNNTGLLVRTWGRVTEIRPAEPPGVAGWLRIEDGSGRNLKCTVTEEIPLHPGWLGRYVTVTGISSCERDLTRGLVPRIEVRHLPDILILD